MVHQCLSQRFFVWKEAIEGADLGGRPAAISAIVAASNPRS
jgi:hypothetical protein